MDIENELFIKCVKTAKENGAADRESWDGVADELVERLREEGVIDEDEDMESLKEDLRTRYPEYEEMVDREGF
jgi:hypothetical protein